MHFGISRPFLIAVGRLNIRKEITMKLTVKRQRSGITIRLEIGDVILTVELPKQNTQAAI
jgi:hypothetical protein